MRYLKNNNNNLLSDIFITYFLKVFQIQILDPVLVIIKKKKDVLGFFLINRPPNCPK